MYNYVALISLDSVTRIHGCHAGRGWGVKITSHNVRACEWKSSGANVICAQGSMQVSPAGGKCFSQSRAKF